MKIEQTAKKMVKEFIEIFPNKCLICSYHRFGIDYGLTKGSVKDHKCIDKENKLKD